MRNLPEVKTTRPRQRTQVLVEEALDSLLPLVQARLDRHGAEQMAQSRAATEELRAIFGERLRGIAPKKDAVPKDGTPAEEVDDETTPELEDEEVVIAESGEEETEDAAPMPPESLRKPVHNKAKRELVPFEIRDDTDHAIIEFERSLIRHGLRDVNDVVLYLRGVSQMNGLFGLMAKREKNGAEASSKILNMLSTVRAVLHAACSLEEKDSIPTHALLGLKGLCEEYSVHFPELAPTMDFLSTRGKSGGDFFDQSHLPEEFRGAETFGYYHDLDPQTIQTYLYNLSVRMAQRGVMYLLMKGLLKEHEASGEDSLELRQIYAAGLKRISLAMHPREIRKAPAILHSDALNRGGLKEAIERKELPKQLWRQQKEVLQAVSRGLDQGENRLYFELPAGTGKTLILATLAKLLNPDGNTLVLTPSTHLSLQDQTAFRTTLERQDVGLVSGFTAVFDQPITVGTYTSFQNYTRRRMFPRDKYSLVLLDEAHRSLSQQRQDIGEYFEKAVLIGATASSQDISGRDVSDVLKNVYFMSFLDGIKAGIVNPMRVHRVPMPTPPGDDVERAGKQDLENRKATIVSLYKKHCHGKQAVVMMETVARAEEVAKAFTEHGIVAKALHSKMPRHATIDRDAEFRLGKFPVLCVCEMLTEGWDYPELLYEVLGDPVGTEWEVLQRVGRVGRQMAGKGESHIFELRGGRIRRRDKMVDLPQQTPIDEVFQNASFVGPQKGFWPKNVFQI